MTGLHTIEMICRDLTCMIDGSWHHRTQGEVALNGDVEGLAHFLYYQYYLSVPNLWATVKDGPVNRMPDKEDPDLVASYMDSLNSLAYRCSDWHINEHGKHSCIVEKNGVQLVLQPHEWERDANTQEFAIVLMPRVRRYATPGFFAACSEAGPFDKKVPIDRIYANADSVNAPKALKALLDWASHRDLPSVVKVANHNAVFARPDTVVAYFPRAKVRDNMGILSKTLAKQDVELRPECPAFTQHLAPGLSWAEDPGAKVSFGMHRCKLIATALTNTEPCQKTPSLEQAVLAAWEMEGLNILAPHLSSSS